jgi:Mg/Co/Ni transporter MgtE
MASRADDPALLVEDALHTGGGSIPYHTAVAPSASPAMLSMPAAVAHTAALHEGVWVTVTKRLSVLVTLLLLQSMSQFILERFEGLISNNMVIPLFLTMLVGAGGNAGNQAAVRSITGLVTGEFTARSWAAVLRKELFMGVVCAAVLFLIGAVRVYFYYIAEPDVTTGLFETVFSVSSALFFIVASSVVIGAALPFALLRLGFNVEHAAPAVQVLMDIIGVFITCVICSAFLPSTPPTVTAVPAVVAAPAGGGLRP